MQPAQSRGALIVIEGLDRAGKTTQVERLVARVQGAGQAAVQIKLPDRSTPTGRTINAYLTSASGGSLPDHAIHLLFAANRWEVLPSILAHLTAGTHVVVDRYSFSGAAYSAAKKVPALDLEWAWAPEIGLPVPDAVVYLTLDEEEQQRRGGWGEERYEKREMQRNVRESFEGVWRGVQGMGVRVVRVDAGEDVDDVSVKVWEGVRDAVERKRGFDELKTLGPLVFQQEG